MLIECLDCGCEWEGDPSENMCPDCQSVNVGAFDDGEDDD